ncbi:MAG: flavocytochrome c, partial [Nitrososphaerota archaeon]|nr:flavocytochrome c [Nitrososphaerota archaeon]
KTVTTTKTETKVEEAKPWLPAKWDEAHEIVIVGTGFAGLSAAIEAYDAGVKDIVILEKMPYVGGNSIINGGQFGALSPEEGDSVDIYVRDMLVAGRYLNYVDLARKVASESRDAFNWLVALGVEFPPELRIQAGGHSVRRTYQTKNLSGRDIVEKLLESVRKRGIPIRTEHKVTRIIREELKAGKVLGVEVETGGKKIYIRSRRALILASGGFGQDINLRKAQWPVLDETVKSTNHPGATGEILLVAKDIGAMLIHIDEIQLYPFAEPETGVLDKPALIPFTAPAYAIYVWKDGKRFVNELAPRDVCANIQLFVLKEKPTWTVFDDAIWPKFTTKEVIEDGLKRGRIIKGNTIEELAEKAGIDPKGLAETVKRYNGFVEKGKDEDFGKPRLLAKIEKPPFYAVPQWPAVHHTMGGLRINIKAQVLDDNGVPIPKLYAAGEVTGGIHGGTRLGSLALPDCIVFGRTAGKEAAKEPVD